MDNYPAPINSVKETKREEREPLDRNQVKTIDSLILGAISSIDNLILKTEGPNA